MFKWLAQLFRLPLFRTKDPCEVPSDANPACIICREPIVPGQFVGQTDDGRLVHAGFHKSTETGKDVLCESGAIGIGFWDGKNVRSSGPSTALLAAESGKPVIGCLTPEGLQTRIVE